MPHSKSQALTATEAPSLKGFRPSKLKRDMRPLTVVIRELTRDKIVTLDEIEAAALRCSPLPTRRNIRTAIDELEKAGWLFEMQDDGWFSGKQRDFILSELTLKPNIQERIALGALAERFFRDPEAKKDYSHIAHYVLLVALQHPKEVADWMQQMADYTRAEALHQKSYLWGDIAAKAVSVTEEDGGDL